MGYEQFNKAISAQQLMQERQREADERALERLDDDEELVGIIRSLTTEEIDDADLQQRRRHRVARK